MNRTFLNLSLVLLIIGVTATAVAAPAAPGTLPLWAGLKPGQFPVGFISTVVMTDPHPLQVSVWYPAQRDGTALRYGDYLKLNLWEGATKPTQADKMKSLAEAKQFLVKNGVDAVAADSLIDAPMYAHLNATVAKGSFPLIFVVQGIGQSASGQAVLSEFLASQGYVVATIPSITRMTGPMAAEKDIAPKAEEELKDIERAMDSLAQWPNMNHGVPVTFVAHSFGGRAALFYAMHHPASGIVSLEGGIGAAAGQKSMVEAKALDLKAKMPPVLHFYELNDDYVTPDFRLLKSLRTPELQLVRMNSMHHVHFSSDGFASVMLPQMAKVTKAGPDLKQEVQSVANQTLSYINKWVQKAPKA
jgi:dienelactone hydrolase